MNGNYHRDNIYRTGMGNHVSFITSLSSVDCHIALLLILVLSLQQLLDEEGGV